jgi:hypothetical protein
MGRPAVEMIDNPCLRSAPIHNSFAESTSGAATSCRNTKSEPKDLTTGTILLRFLRAQFQVVICRLEQECEFPSNPRGELRTKTWAMVMNFKNYHITAPRCSRSARPGGLISRQPGLRSVTRDRMAHSVPSRREYPAQAQAVNIRQLASSSRCYRFLHAPGGASTGS